MGNSHEKKDKNHGDGCSRLFDEFIQHGIIVGGIGFIGLATTFLVKDEQLKVIMAAVSLLLLVLLYLLRPARNLPGRWLRVLRAGTRFRSRASIHHELIHKGRDLEVQMLPKVELYIRPGQPRQSNTHRASPPELLLKHRTQIIAMLGDMLKLFEMLAPAGVRVWVSLRELKEDRCYHTFHRMGKCSPNRGAQSQPLDYKKSKTINYLRSNLQSGRCVVITGSGMGSGFWTPQPNDELGEDRCVLMSAVSVRSNSGKPVRQIAWILSVCADNEEAFDESHVSLMQSCTDTFSSVLNVMVRAKHWENAPSSKEEANDDIDDALEEF